MNQVNRGEWISDGDVDGWDLEFDGVYITRWFQLHNGIERVTQTNLGDYSISNAPNHENCSSNVAARARAHICVCSRKQIS